tara:strand:- start:61 stop:321 length:261 start_codon:yes stop_codon:yes gene_type:complete
MMISQKITVFLLFNFFVAIFLSPAGAVTTKMFKVLDTCARYRLNQFDSFEALEKLKLEYSGQDESEANMIIKKYCSVFTPNENIEY